MTPPRVSYSITKGNFYNYYRPTWLYCIIIINIKWTTLRCFSIMGTCRTLLKFRVCFCWITAPTQDRHSPHIPLRTKLRLSIRQRLFRFPRSQSFASSLTSPCKGSKRLESQCTHCKMLISTSYSDSPTMILIRT